MRRISFTSSQVGSSTVETLMVGALVVLVAAAVVGVTLVLSLGSRRNSGSAAPSVPSVSVVPVPVIEITCAADGASIDGAAVNATSEGVPVRIVGDEGALLSFRSPGTPAYPITVFEPSGSYRLPLAPGGWGVACAGTGAGSGPVALGVFEVRDPAGVYLRTRPECPTSGCCDEIVDLPPGFADDDLGTLHDGLADAGVRPTDTIERAGYPDSTFSAQPPSPLVYRVVRDLQIVARLEVAGEGDAWSANMFGCPAG